MGERWNGFGSAAGQQLIEYQKKINFKPYIPLTKEEIFSLQSAGFLSKHKKPKITKLGYNEIHEAKQDEWEDIQREAREVGLIK